MILTEKQTTKQLQPIAGEKLAGHDNCSVCLHPNHFLAFTTCLLGIH